MSSTKQAKISDLNREESQRLRAIWDSTGHGGLSQEAFGQRYEIGSQAAVGFFLGGKSALSLKAAKGFAHGLNCKISDFSDRLAAEANELSQVSDHSFATITAPMSVIKASASQEIVHADEASLVRVPLLENSGEMGEGSAMLDGDVIAGQLTLNPSWVSSTLHPSRHDALRFIHSYGDSMTPTFNSGDVLLVDTGINEVRIDGVYVLNAHDRLFIKRVRQRLDGVFEISSDNPTHKTVDELNGGHAVQVLGRVIWVWNGRRT